MKKYLSIYPSIYQTSLFVDIQIEDEDFCRFSDFLKLQIRYVDSVDNTVQENSSVFSPIRMRWLP